MKYYLVSFRSMTGRAVTRVVLARDEEHAKHVAVEAFLIDFEDILEVELEG